MAPRKELHLLNYWKDTFRCIRYKSVSRDLGIAPERLFFDRSNSSKLIMLPNDWRMEPCILLSAKERCFRSSRSPMVIGISPVSWFLDKSNSVKTFKFPMSDGRDPLREFADKFMCKISLRPHNVDCIVELNPFEANERVLRELRLPKHAGIEPMSLLPVKYKKAKFSGWHNSEGMVPCKLLFCRDKYNIVAVLIFQL